MKLKTILKMSKQSLLIDLLFQYTNYQLNQDNNLLFLSRIIKENFTWECLLNCSQWQLCWNRCFILYDWFRGIRKRWYWKYWGKRLNILWLNYLKKNFIRNVINNSKSKHRKSGLHVTLFWHFELKIFTKKLLPT